MNAQPPSLAQRLNEKLFRVTIIAALAFLALSLFRPLMDNVDLGWHVAQGRWMAQHHAIYRHDVMTYANGGHALINEYPLFQIILFGMWNLGQGGLYLFTLGLYGLLIFTFLRAAREFLPEGSALIAVTLTLMLFYFLLAFPLRPHVVTYLALGMMGTFLLQHRNATTWMEFWPIALLQVAWTNSHSAFVLGPIMVGLFGVEMIARKSFELKRLAWETGSAWAGAFLFILAACLVNPFGWMRFYPPLYQGGLAEIRAYVGEMQPLTGQTSSLITLMTVVAAGSCLLAIIRARGGFSFAFLLLAILLYVESLSVLKSWPVFGIFPVLLVLSSGAFRREGADRNWTAWPSLVGNLVVTTCLMIGLYVKLEGNSTVSVPAIWKEYNLGRREMPYPVVDWMRAHGIQGRLLHRCEDGGLLQERGYDHGQTFSDTGFGKYDERRIRIVSMIGERPALLPLYCSTFRPEFVICNSLAFRWPFYLRQSGWRMIFYSVSGTVWTRPDVRTDLPTVTDGEVDASFLNDIERHGRPADLLLYGRDLIALNSAGREDLAFSQLTSLPSEMRQSPWYWEAARIMAFETPRLSLAHRKQLLAEAELLHDPALTGEFRAFAAADDGKEEVARAILESIPRKARGSHANDLLLKIENDEHRPEALGQAESPTGVDLRDGEHWAYVARAEDTAGHEKQAKAAWEQAIFFYPDDPEISAGAAAFAAKVRDPRFAQEVSSRLELTGP